ncbi:hypothetical protein FLONG3_4404 [Fusarium longipes]|uniref:Uncharacterized protein n=1 Tax=Fusarium longipes TaxID=694270 RepID=A0A395SZT9_9HYPO|nr:hypothetical protein FLONG3_4404 [Fusarium longipes]
MLTGNPQIKPLRGASLCRKHFENHALAHITKAKKPRTTTKYAEPLRVQPRRAAKDKHPLAKTNTKKRVSDEELSSSTAKRRKANNSASHTKKWDSFIVLLEKQVSAIAEKATERGPDNCSFGPAPWECHMCTSNFAELVVKKLAIVKPEAPVANMATVGKILKLNSKMYFGKGEMTTFEWEGLSYIIDACRVPMFMVL